jgi:hypothetical protein
LILDEITLGLHQFFDLSDVGVLWVDYINEEYISIARAGDFIEPLKPGVYRQAFGTGLIGRCHKTGATVLINDTKREPEMVNVPGVPILSEMIVPIKYKIPEMLPRVLAIFDVGNVNRHAFDMQQRELLETVAACLAPALFDPLNYLANIEPMMTATNSEWDPLIRTLSFMNTYLAASRQRSSLQLSHATEILADTAADQATKSMAQAQHVEQTVQTATELSATTRLVAAQTYELSNLGEVTATQVAICQVEVSQTVESMQQLAFATGLNSAIGTNLLQGLKEIQRVGILLEEVGEETSVLALNATIEAAGAVTMSHRFGVVATEVRELAERVKADSRYIRNLLREVEVQAQDLQSNSTEIGQGIIRLSQQLSGASNTLLEALNLVQLTKTSIQSVAQLTNQQEHNGSTIIASMEETRALTKLIAQQEAELAEAIAQLKEIAARLGS